MLYTLMHKEIPVADFIMDDGDILEIRTVHASEHIPVGIVQTAGKPVRASLNQWWQNRGIPASRSGLKKGLEILGVTHQKKLLDKSYGLSLTDHYWIRPKEQSLSWKEMNFFEHSFSDDVGNALFGNRFRDENHEIDYISPCSASDGWLKKKWKIIHGKRVLVKSGSGPFLQEPYNEVIATALHKRLGVMPYTPYELLMEQGQPYSLCENFITKDTELISAYQLINSEKKRNDVSFYEHFTNLCKKNGVENVTEYLDYMLATDYLIANTDRHYNNFGLIRSADTLQYLGFAPIYDSGTSFWSDKTEQAILRDEEIPANPFKKYHGQQIHLVSDFSFLEFSKLRDFDEEAAAIWEQADTITPERKDVLCHAVKKQLMKLEEIALQNHHGRSNL